MVYFAFYAIWSILFIFYFIRVPSAPEKMSECQTKAGNQNTLTHSLTPLSLSHSHSLTLSHSYSLTLDMLNNFCFHVYAQKLLIIGKNGNEGFLRHHRPCQ